MNNKILIVEDENITATSIKLILEQAGYSTCPLASTGKEAISIAQKEKPNLALLDIKLKGNMNGIETGQVLKKMNIPIIFLTAYTDAEIRSEAKKVEPYGYFEKPFISKELLSTIEFALYKSVNEKKVNRLNLLFNAQRKLNKILLKENQSLLKIRTEICDIFVNENIYDISWLLLFEDKNLLTFSMKDKKEEKKIISLINKKEEIKNLMKCANKNRYHDKAIFTVNKERFFNSCPILKNISDDFVAFLSPLFYNGSRIGIFGGTFEISQLYSSEKKESYFSEELEIFSEFAEQIGYSIGEIYINKKASVKEELTYQI
ncbi:MAG: response regulator [Spirochaetia bacterium]|nr:response regulator [Spirochaetia bacterium]